MSCIVPLGVRKHWVICAAFRMTRSLEVSRRKLPLAKVFAEHRVEGGEGRPEDEVRAAEGRMAPRGVRRG